MRRIAPKLRQKARGIALLLLDVDGVLTDGGIMMDERGREVKRFDVRDGQGIQLLHGAEIQVGLITGRSSRAVDRRAKELGIRLVYQNSRQKLDAYRKIKQETGLHDGEIAYIGDDLTDIPILKRVGLAAAVNDCSTELKRAADYVTEKRGGRGAVREVIELILQAQGKWDKLTENYFK